jgi:hypothetical protein
VDGTPAEVLWATYAPPSDVRADMWKETWKMAEQATGLKITVVEEASVAWQKRQTELAAGMTSVDITYNQLNWVIGGGLQGMFVDHGELLRRDKVDTKQYYKAELDSWAWKGKQWGIPFATGGETVLYNKKLFDAKGVKYPHKDWTYDEFLDACRRLNDPANRTWAVQINQNGIHYMLGTFLLNFGGKRLNDAKDKAEIESMAAEMIDRFGPLPDEVAQLLKIMAIKVLCRRANVAKVDGGPKGIIVTFRDNAFANPAGLVSYVAEQGSFAKVRPDMKIVFMRDIEDLDERLKATTGILRNLVRIAERKQAA